MQAKITQGIKFRFILVFIVILSGLSIIAYTYDSTLEINAEGEQETALLFTTSGLISQIELNVRRAREAEKNYLFEKNNKYAAEHAVILSGTRALIDKLHKLIDQNNTRVSGRDVRMDSDQSGHTIPTRETGAINTGTQDKNPRDRNMDKQEGDVATISGRMLRLLNEYESNFKAVVEAKEKKFISIGALLELVQTLEETIPPVGDLKLTNAFLKIRGLEKDYIATEDSRFVTQLNNVMKDFAMLLIDTEMDDNRRNEISKLMNNYNLGMLALTNGTKTVADRVSRFNEIVNGLDPLMAELKEKEKTSYESSHQEIQTRISESNNIFIITSIIVGIICLLCLLNVARYITRNIEDIVSTIKQFSRGNLAIDLFQNDDRDEISLLYNSLYHMRLKLTEVISGIRTGAGNVGTASEQVAQGNANLSQRTQEQASNLEEIASSMEEMTSTVSQNADNAQQASRLAMGAREQAEQGGHMVSKVIAAMTSINTASQKITDIIGVIDEIAFQTNLLALNAAVEAARAGVNGRGFAVVAAEVRNLAGRSAVAAKQIKTLIQDSVLKTQDGASLANESGHVLSEIVQATKKVSEIVTEIAAASLEQSDGINQVNKALLQIDEMTQQNVTLVDEAAEASRTMRVQAEELNKLVAYFRLEVVTNIQTEKETVFSTINRQKTFVADSSRETIKLLPKRKMTMPRVLHVNVGDDVVRPVI